MAKTEKIIEILMVGVDPFSTEGIKTSLKENGVKYHISMLRDLDELESFDKRIVQAVFFYSNRQSQKTVDEIKKIQRHFPRAGITLLSPRPDLQGVVSAFRGGLFDFLSLPLDPFEIKTVIYRLKLHETIHTGKWNPERAVLQLFSRPESFSRVKDIANNLMQYLEIFFTLEKELRFASNDKLLSSLQKKLKISDKSLKRIKRFLRDETGLIFGLRFHQDKFYFLLKNGDGTLSYLVIQNTSEYEVKDIFSDYLSNVLRTSLSILAESKKKDEIRLMALTDEVTGLFNQRKLLEDLELHIGRYKNDKVEFSLLFVDVDYFKNVNDQFGHVVGSQLLTDIAGILKSQLRSSDLVYRYGGDEFIVLLPRTSVEETKKIALRISESVKNSEFKVDHDKNYHLSLSIGLASYPNDASNAKSIIDFADKMMYMSKKSGRGKVFHVTEVVA